MKEKGFTPIIIILGVLAVLGITSGAYYLGTLKSQPQSISQTQNVQTQDNTTVISTQSPASVAQTLPTSNLKNTPSPQILPTNTPSSNTATYIVPKTWTRVATSYGLILCLPPKWETDQWGGVYFNRDPAYRPSVTYIKDIPYTSGSRREAYYKFWETEYPNVRQTVEVDEVSINNNTVLKFNGPEGEFIVWLANGKLWQAGISGWSMVNDSKTVFLKDFYTMISCSF